VAFGQHIQIKNIYKRHRFPPSIIQYAVWLYYRFNLSTRDVEDLLAERNISVSYGYSTLDQQIWP
jgi:transposase-like protein